MNYENVPTNTISIDEHINNLVQDSRTLVYDLAQSDALNYDVIEFKADIPERPEPELFVSMVMRWVEISQLYNKPIRVYAYVNNNKSEKYIQRLVSSREDISVTIIPYYLRKRTTR